MLAKCAQFRAGESSEFAEKGTQRHALLRVWLDPDDKLKDFTCRFDADDVDAIEWAADYIKLHAPTSDYPIEVEQRREWLGPEFEERAGTPDAVCGWHVFDFKWRQRDYSAQMADYALAVFDSNPKFVEAKCHVLYGQSKRHEVMTFTLQSATQVVSRILARADDPHSQPAPNEYCGWCAKRMTCSAFIDQANRVIENREDWRLSTFHASEITTADEMGKALTIARQLAKWCEAVEHFAKEMQVKQGMTPTGFEMKPTKGRSYITDVAAAFQLLGLTQSDFLACCEPRMKTSEKYPDKLGIVDIFARVKEMKKAPAKREVEKRLEPVIKRGADGIKLVALNKNEGEETETD